MFVDETQMFSFAFLTNNQVPFTGSSEALLFHKMASYPFDVDVTKLRIKKPYIIAPLIIPYLLPFQRKPNNKQKL